MLYVLLGLVFGISDFAISTIVYRRLKWVSDRTLPGTPLPAHGPAATRPSATLSDRETTQKHEDPVRGVPRAGSR